MKLSLVVLAAGKQQGTVIPIKPPRFVIGRDPQCHLRPASPLIGERHCAVLQQDGRAFVRDLGGAGATSLNGRPVQGEADLHDGDRVQVGPLLFAVRIEATPTDGPASPPAAAPPPATPDAGPHPLGEDDIAAMLLEQPEGESSAPPPRAEAPPEGGTSGEPAPPGGRGVPARPSGGGKPGPTPGDTAGAARRILGQFKGPTRRPR